MSVTGFPGAKSDEPTAKIVPVALAGNLLCTNIFIDHDGRRFYSRVNYPLSDTPHARAAQVQAFLQRQKRYENADRSR